MQGLGRGRGQRAALWMTIVLIAGVCWASGPQVVGHITRWAMQVTEATTLQGTQMYGTTVQ